MARTHLVVLKKEYLSAILDGRKTVESRFTKMAIEPFGRIAAGDVLLLKMTSGPVCAKAKAGRVEQYENLTLRQMRDLYRRYNTMILGNDAYWQSKRSCPFGVLVWLEEVEKTKPVWIDKKDWRAWVVLQPERDFGLLNRKI